VTPITIPSAPTQRLTERDQDHIGSHSRGRRGCDGIFTRCHLGARELVLLLTAMALRFNSLPLGQHNRRDEPPHMQ
jgi:hypothetical protein